MYGFLLCKMSKPLENFHVYLSQPDNCLEARSKNFAGGEHVAVSFMRVKLRREFKGESKAS